MPSLLWESTTIDTISIFQINQQTLNVSINSTMH